MPRQTSEANRVQHGGDHYNVKEYQHWDFVCDTHIHYLHGCATKYISRWKEKGGKLDLQKAAHYLVKAEEQGVPVHTHHTTDAHRFAEQFGPWEEKVLKQVMRGDIAAALAEINRKIEAL